MTDTYTSAYFQDQAAELRERIGTRSFWHKPDAAELAIKALGWVYLRLAKPSPTDKLTWELTIRELAMRQAIVEARPPGWLVEATS